MNSKKRSVAPWAILGRAVPLCMATVALWGCAVNAQEGTEPIEEVETVEQEIYGGTPSGVNFGIVQIAWYGKEANPCTGYFISRRHIVTSAHCMDGRYGSQWYKVYTKTGYNSFAYMRDSRRTDNWILMQQNVYPGWRYDYPDARYDTAILTLPPTATVNTPATSQMLRVSTAAPRIGQMHNLFGWGAYGIGPTGMLLPWNLLFGENATVSSVSPGMFRSTSTGIRLTCVGDSGAPSTRYIGGNYVATGTHRGSTDMRCASSGEPLFWSDTSSKVPWIESTLRATFGPTFSCRRYGYGADAHMACF